MTVFDAIEKDLDSIRRYAPSVADSGLAAAALALAAEVDRPRNSATSKSMCAKVLMETMDRIRAIAPETKSADRIDDLHAKRTARRAAAP